MSCSAFWLNVEALHFWPGNLEKGISVKKLLSAHRANLAVEMIVQSYR
jgi:hypothetical protein